MNNLRRIQNNTNDAIMINGIFIAAKGETVLTNEIVKTIDKTYFLSGILVDLGEYQVDQPSINIETSNSEINNKEAKVVTDESPKTKRRRRTKKNEEVVNVVEKFDNDSANLTKQENLKKDKSLQSNSLDSQDFNVLTSMGITEEDLLNYLAGYYKKPPTGIPINDFDEDVRALLERAKRAILKKQVSFEDLNSELQNIIKSSNPTDVDGDGNPDSSLGSGGIADIIGSQILIPIKESMLDKDVKDTLNKAKTAYQKPEEGIPFEDLSGELKEKIDNLDEENHYWKEPVVSVGMLPFTNNKNGDMRLVMDTNKFYRWDEDIMNWIEPLSSLGIPEDEVPTSDPSVTTSILGEFFAYKNQTRFKLAVPYNMGTNQMMVMLNGLLVYNEEDYTEINNRTIDFNYPLLEDDYVVFALSTTNPSNVIVTQMVEIDFRIREIKLRQAYMPGSDSLRVFLNGVQLQEGANGDYIEFDTRTVTFNIDLLPGDILAFRLETNTVSKNIANQMAQFRTIYSDLAKKIEQIQQHIDQSQFIKGGGV